MNGKILGILVTTLLIASILPTVCLPTANSMDENDVTYPYFRFTVENGFGSNTYNEIDNNCGCASGEHGLGYIPLPEWVESTPLPEYILPPPSSWDWRNHNGKNWMTSVKQQLCGDCWAFAAIGALEAMINIDNNNPNLDYDLSEQYLVSCVPPEGDISNNCSGGNPHFAYKYIDNNEGALLETCFPYQGRDCSHPTAPVCCEDKCTSWQTQLVPIADYGHSNNPSITAIKNQLVNVGPIVLNFVVYENFYNNLPGAFDGNGVHVNPSGSKIGGHGVVIAGYKDDSTNYPTHGGYWICKNSWGTTWGPWGNGYFGIAYTVASIEREMSWVTSSSTANNPPTAYIDSISPNPAAQGQPVSFLGHGTDTDGTVTDYNWRSSIDGEIGTGNLVVSSSLSPGTHTIYFKVQDNKGTWSTEVSETLVVNSANNPPTAYIDSISPNPAAQGQTVTFNGHGDDDGTITGYNWRSDLDGQLNTLASFSSSTLSVGTHTIYFKVKDNDDLWSTEVSETLMINTNSPPSQPTTPTGQTTSCKINQPYPYSTNATDPDPGDKVKYGWDWTGDGNVDEWDDNNGNYYTPGTQISTEITWTTKQTTYSLKVIAEDLNGAQSSWSNPLTVTTSKSKPINTPFLRFLENHPYMFPILRQLMEL